jgi:hypothetical protein
MTKGQGVECDRDRADEPGFGICVREKSSRPQAKKPHADTEPSQKAPKPFCQFLEHNGKRSKCHSREENCHKIRSLYRHTHRRVHHIYNQDLIRQ